MLRKRFPADRIGRVVGWTSVSVAWGAVVATRVLGSPAAADPPIAVPENGTPIRVVASTTPVTMPDLPRDGLTVIRVPSTVVAIPAAAERAATKSPQVSANASATADERATGGGQPAPTEMPAPVVAPRAPVPPPAIPAAPPPPPATSGGS